ncbi:MAG: chemotaxis protein CheR, partial [Nitrospira sp.]|nr:chemotaxis protein CheR [Nitrospira sp.]
MDYPITKQEYNRIRTLLYEESGISLGENKQSLVVSRLSKRLRELEIDNFATYYDHVTQDDS